jgi:hypothetical protein
MTMGVIDSKTASVGACPLGFKCNFSRKVIFVCQIETKVLRQTLVDSIESVPLSMRRVARTRKYLSEENDSTSRLL